MLRTLRLTLYLLTIFTFCIADFAPLSSVPIVGEIVSMPAAQAQTRKRRRSLLSVLFGRRPPRKKAVVRKRVRRASIRKRRRNLKKRIRRVKRARLASRKRRTNKRSRRTKRRVAPSATPVIVQKREDSRAVLVVGDFYATGLAKGLEEAFVKIGGIRVIDRTWASSGLVRNDLVNWPVRVGELVEEHKPDYVVMMVGANDRQLIRENGRKFQKRTPEWLGAYTKRIDGLGQALKAAGVSFTWMGLPPVRFNSMNKDFLEFNELYRKSAIAAGGKFIDVWDGFAGPNGEYSRSGPDVNGQIVLLRSRDGINITRSGRRRLAFYVENEIQRVLKEGASPVLAAGIDLDDGQDDVEVYDPEKSGRTVVIRLDDPTVDGSATLAGADVDLSSELNKRPQVPVVASSAPGTAGVRSAGRVDNFSWPPNRVGEEVAVPAVASAN